MQVKGVMLLRHPNPGKHRPAKPCGKGKVNTFLNAGRFCYACGAGNREISGKQPEYRAAFPKRSMMEKEKEAMRRVGFYLKQDLLDWCDSLLSRANVRSRNEFVNEALRFYCGYLTARQAENYLLQSLSSVMTGTVQDSENRLARMDFKIAVELSKLAQVIAYTHEVDEEDMKRLHAKCVEEVRRINGAVDFESAYKYQKREG